MPEHPYEFDALLVLLGDLEDWLHELGLLNYDRLHQAVDVMKHVIKERIKLREEHAAPAQIKERVEPTKLLAFTSAQVEVMEFLEIFDAFRQERTDVLKAKLSRALSGPLLLSTETTENAAARNVAFELALAAEWRKYGLEVEIGEPDITLKLKGLTYYVECKRPFREHSIRSNVRSAMQQLAAKLDSPQCESAFGLIAISATRILSPGEHIFIAADRSDLTAIKRPLKELMRKNLRHWANFDKHSRIVAILFHAMPPTYTKTGIIGAMSSSLLTPVGSRGPAFNFLLDEMRDAYML